MTPTAVAFRSLAARLMVVFARVGHPAQLSVRYCGLRCLRLRRKGLIGATLPRGSDEQARQAFQREAQDGLVGEGTRQVDQHLGFPLDHLCCEL